MKTLLIASFLFLSALSSFGQHFNEKYGQPIVVLYETNPWLMVIGSDVPSFALYENGQIIYRKIVNKRYKYFQVQTEREKTQRIIKTFGITDSLMKMGDYTSVSATTDQPTNILILNFDTVRQISVYGNLQHKEEARKQTPSVFLTVYDNILKFEDNAASEWLPDSIEVMLTKYDYSPEKPLSWNSTWGDIHSATTVKHDDNMYSLYIDKKYFDDLVKLMGKLTEKQAVEVNGGKYAISYRLPFPNLR